MDWLGRDFVSGRTASVRWVERKLPTPSMCANKRSWIGKLAATRLRCVVCPPEERRLHQPSRIQLCLYGTHGSAGWTKCGPHTASITIAPSDWRLTVYNYGTSSRLEHTVPDAFLLRYVRQRSRLASKPNSSYYNKQFRQLMVPA